MGVSWYDGRGWFYSPCYLYPLPPLSLSIFHSSLLSQPLSHSQRLKDLAFCVDQAGSKMKGVVTFGEASNFNHF
jgi:hypothetical protein